MSSIILYYLFHKLAKYLTNRKIKILIIIYLKIDEKNIYNINVVVFYWNIKYFSK